MVRRLVTLAMALALCAPTLVAAAELRQQSSRDWDAVGLKRVEVHNPSGDISVGPSRDGRVHLVALQTIHNSDQRGADQLARDTKLLADVSGGVLKLEVRYPARREIRINVWDLVKHMEWPEIDVELALEVPPGVQVTLRTASGDLQTSGIAAAQELRTTSGDVDVDGAGGELSIDTRSGDVTAGSVARASIGTSSGNVIVGSARGALTVQTRSGDVRIDSASDSVTVDTASGEVRVGMARLGLDARTGSGDITARAGGAVRVETTNGETKLALIAPFKGAEFQSGSGDVTLRLAQGIECRIDAQTEHGDLEIALPLVGRTTKDNHVTGRLGRGTAAIVIRTSSGSINVAR